MSSLFRLQTEINFVMLGLTFGLTNESLKCIGDWRALRCNSTAEYLCHEDHIKYDMHNRIRAPLGRFSNLTKTSMVGSRENVLLMGWFVFL